MDCRHIILLIFGLASVSGRYERVWLRDLTTDHSRRTLEDGLPPLLSYELNHNGRKIDLHLQENTRLNVNAPVYEGSRTGLHLRKYPPITDVKFYQDKQNGGSFHVKCEKGTQPCKRHLSGNLFLNDVNYDVSPALSKLASHVPSKYRALGSPYRLVRTQNSDKKASSKQNPADVNNSVKNKTDYLVPPTSEVNDDKMTPSDVIKNRGTDYRVPPINIEKKTEKEGEILKKLKELLEKKKKIIQPQRVKRQQSFTYAVELLIVVDPYLWQQYYSITPAENGLTQEEATELQFRHVFSHIVNGMSLRYEAIDDPEMDIYLTLSGFVFYKRIEDFTPLLPTSSMTTTSNGQTFVDAERYLNALGSWANTLSAYSQSDHIMTFTSTNLFTYTIADDDVIGLAWVNGTCKIYKTSINEFGPDFHLTVTVATHELGHNLGSLHDGTQGCSRESKYIMAPSVGYLSPGEGYTINPWRFSDCSVQQFKDYITSLKSNCLLDKGDYFNLEEYNEHVSKLPGERYNITEQCKLFLGTSATLCENQSTTSESICTYGFCCETSEGRIAILAAMGTPCGPPGENKWCFEGRCEARPEEQTTRAPTTKGPTTQSPTTQSPTTQRPTTQSSTTQRPTTQRPTTEAPTTQSPTTFLPTAEPDMTSCSGDTGFYGYSCADLGKYFSRTTLCYLFEEECCSTCGACVDKGYYGFDCSTVLRWLGYEMCEYEAITKACCQTCSNSSLSDYYYYYY